MENKRMVMLVVMMLVMGNIMIKTNAVPFKECYEGCVLACVASAQGVKKALCPATCLKTCIHPNQTDYFCKRQCATDRCLSSSPLEDKDHAEKVSVCVDSCSDTCSHKN